MNATIKTHSAFDFRHFQGGDERYKSLNRRVIYTPSVYRLITSGSLRASRVGVGRGTLRVSEDALDSYLQSAEVSVARKPKPSRATLKHIEF